jgi:hypothetical protein
VTWSSIRATNATYDHTFHPYNIVQICELPSLSTPRAEAEQFLAKLIMTLGIKSDIREGRAIIIR